MGYFKGKRVLIYGLAKSGQAAANLLLKFGAKVWLYDDDLSFKDKPIFENDPFNKDYDIIVVSPGIKVIGNKLIEHFAAKKTLIISELDLGYLFCEGKIIGITGTNGKTTVTSLIGQILARAGKKVFVCGNIGQPISNIALKTTKKSFVVCEVSNFQLELSRFFKPNVALILNLDVDHLSRHESFLEYVRVKNKISENFLKKDYLIKNLDDKNSELVKSRGKVLTFSTNFMADCYCKEGFIVYKNKKVLPVNEVKLIGNKNLSNVLAAVLAVKLFKVKNRVIRKAVSSFLPLEHRLELFLTKDGVSYINDSKATNISSLKMAIESLDKEPILLCGGQIDINELAEFFKSKPKIKKIICFGEAYSKVYSLAIKNGYLAEKFSLLKQAIEFVKKTAKSGDTVLFSPGGKSFDEFNSYEERGKFFKEMINED